MKHTHTYPDPNQGLVLTIDGYWQRFKASILASHPELSPEQMGSVRKIFYAGACSIYVMHVDHLTQLPDRMAIMALDDLRQEVLDFHAETNAAAAIHRAKA